jgi:hypothetical protein
MRVLIAALIFATLQPSKPRTVPLDGASGPVIGTITIALGSDPITVPVTADHVAAIKAAIAGGSYPPEASAPRTPPKSVEEFVARALRSAVRTAMIDYSNVQRLTGCAAFHKLSAADQRAIVAKLGGANICLQ